ncbi:MAG TPA: GNAT family N-acetyltransferase [Ardenticatenaceae bacterium]|nr:GNAT family N-acetyltransferase [Ardenticatenaceae bacterium]
MASPPSSVLRPPSLVLERRIEEASLNAWPALQQILFDGWVLRFSRGYTKRANSVNPLYESGLDVQEKIARCEQLYEERGLAPVFRLTPLASPVNLDEALAAHGYEPIDPTLVLHLDLSDETRGKPGGDTPNPSTEARRRGVATTSAPRNGSFTEAALDEWLETFGRLHGAQVEQQHVHRAILDLIPARRLLAALIVDGIAVACGLGVLEADCFGLFDLVTGPVHRRKGYGTALVSAMLQWAEGQGASLAYLQVMATNEPAQQLYAKLGFRELYQYWYRVRPARGLLNEPAQ